MWLTYFRTVDGQDHTEWLYGTPIINVLEKFGSRVEKGPGDFYDRIEVNRYMKPTIQWLNRLDKKWRVPTKKQEDGTTRYDLRGFEDGHIR